MGLFDSINAENLKSTLATASKVVQKAEDALKTVASATNEIVAEKQAVARQKKEADVTYERMQITKNQSVNMRQTFPDSFAMRSDIDAYRNNLKRIEQKFAV